MMQIRNYVSKPRYMKAVEVTRHNIPDVSEWLTENEVSHQVVQTFEPDTGNQVKLVISNRTMVPGYVIVIEGDKMRLTSQKYVNEEWDELAQ